VKIGSATLTLEGTNTYTGATVVRKGTIKLGADDVINSASKLVLDGGSLDMNGKSQTFSDFEITENGGSVVNGTLALAGLTVDFDEIAAGKRLEYASPVRFAAGAKIDVLNAGKVSMPPYRYRLAEFGAGSDLASLAVSDTTLAELPERWQVRVEGSRIVLCYPVGTVLTFR
jgi:autotransporter-associated beta strand protein